MVTRWRSEIGSNRAIEIANGKAQFCLVGDVSGSGDIMPVAMPCPASSAGAESIMRAQAVAATTIAPVIAIACLQPSAGMPMCARRVRHNIPRLRPAPRRGARSLRE
jgi:hypothetical protein